MLGESALLGCPHADASAWRIVRHTMMKNFFQAAIVLVVLLCSRSMALASQASPTPALSGAPATSPQPSPQVSPAATKRPGVDPCALLGQSDVASALGVGIDQVRAPTRPTPNECLWAGVVHTSGPAQQVLLTVDAAQAAKSGCRGLGCLSIVQSVTDYIPGMSSFNRAVGTAEDVEYITGLGDKAAWKNGQLTVLKQGVVFGLDVSAAHSSSALAASELLARTVLTRI